jgi:hypothetical protein
LEYEDYSRVVKHVSEGWRGIYKLIRMGASGEYYIKYFRNDR